MRHPLLRGLQLMFFAIATSLFAPAVGAAPNSFQATIFFTEQVAPTGQEPCFLIGTISGIGAATKLGTVNLASTDCINPLPPEFTSYAFSSSVVMLTASNGDQLWATYAGVLSEEGVIAGSYIIYGGTGRFAKAKGSGTVEGFETIDPTAGTGSGQIQLKGVLSY